MFHAIRVQYRANPLLRHDMQQDPVQQFRDWLAHAIERGVPEANGVALATADAQGRPSVRMVLLKEVDARGFVFFTNYLSRKARELEENPRAAMAFWWQSLHRQVRVEGRVERVSAEESDAYFGTRPPGARLGAWASVQSQPIASRAELEQRVAEVEQRFAGQEIPRPEFWGGFRLVPETIEFWQGRQDRLHDRVRFARTDAGTWVPERLMP